MNYKLLFQMWKGKPILKDIEFIPNNIRLPAPPKIEKFWNNHDDKEKKSKPKRK